jgi:hypothetical protein
VCGVVLACGRFGGRDAAPQAYEWSRDTLVALPELLGDPATPVTRGEVIGRPRFVRATSEHIFVSDVSVDRVAVLDPLARFERWIGVRGGGPGELYGVGHLEVRGRTLFVAEALNGRVSEFAFDGAFIRSLRSRYAAGSIGATSQAVLAISRSDSHYAAQIDMSDDPPRALRRPPARSPNRWTVLTGHDLLAADSAHWWVFDQGTGDVCEFDSPRATARCRAFPAALLARLSDYRNRRVAMLEESIHQRVRAAPLVKDMVCAGPSLVFLLPLPDLPLVVLDVSDGSLTPVMLRSRVMPAWLRAATSLAWDGRSFVTVGDEGIGRLSLLTHRASNYEP